MMECDSASESGTFPGTKWRTCDPAVDGDGGGDSPDGGDETPDDGDKEGGGGVAGVLKKNAKLIGIGCAGAAGFGLLLFSYFRWKGTFATLISPKHRKGVDYTGNKKGGVKGSVKGRYQPKQMELV